MAPTIRTKEVRFSDGTVITVSQANWAISMRLTRLEEQAQATPVEDQDESLFHQVFYPKLSACSSGEKVPSELDALAMPTDDLDLWFAAVRELNPSWFSPLEEELTPEEEEKKRSPSEQ